jgi:hypothetical protein
LYNLVVEQQDKKENKQDAIRKKNELLSLPKVRSFLDSVNRNSKKTREAYAAGLIHFQDYLKHQPSYKNKNKNKNKKYDCQTVLEALKLRKNPIDVYEMLDSFVSYILNKRQGISPKSIYLYVHSIRSYLAHHGILVIPYNFKRRVRMPKILHGRRGSH